MRKKMKIKYPQKYIENQRYNFCGLVVNYKAAKILFRYYKRMGTISHKEELEDYAIGQKYTKEK